MQQGRAQQIKHGMGGVNGMMTVCNAIPDQPPIHEDAIYDVGDGGAAHTCNTRLTSARLRTVRLRVWTRFRSRGMCVDRVCRGCDCVCRCSRPLATRLGAAWRMVRGTTTVVS
jgi:hypothetical protein